MEGWTVRGLGTGDRRQETGEGQRVRGVAKNQEAKDSRGQGFKDSSGKPYKPYKSNKLEKPEKLKKRYKRNKPDKPNTTR